VLAIKCLNLSKELSKGGVRIGIDGGAEVVVVAAKAFQDIVKNFIIIERFPHNSEFSSDALHLGKILVSREIILACIVEVRAELLDPGLGLARDMSVEGCPDGSRGVEADNVSKHIGRQGINEPAQNLLITRDPRLIVGVDDDDLLVVGVLSGDKLLRRLVLALNKIKHAGTPQRGDHQRLPHKRVVTRQWLGRRGPESSSKGSGGHRR
jgi:hypothetical protein